MADVQGTGRTPAGGKRSAESGAENPLPKVQKTAVRLGSWVDNSFSTPQTKLNARPNVAQTALRPPRWISPAFGEQASTSRGPNAASTSSAARQPVAPSSTPRSLHKASQRAGNIILPPSTPGSPAKRRVGPPAFALPGKQTKTDERIHHALSTVKAPVPPLAGKSPATTKFGIAGSQQKPPPMPIFGVRSDDSHDIVDELERGLVPSPEKKNRTRPKGNLTDRAELIIARQATSNKLWSISDEAAAMVPDLRMDVLAILSTMPGRVLTRCRLMKGNVTLGEGDAGEGLVLFAAGTKDLKDGMSVGIWRPWAELAIKPLESPLDVPVTAENNDPPSNADQTNTIVPSSQSPSADELAIPDSYEDVNMSDETVINKDEPEVVQNNEGPSSPQELIHHLEEKAQSAPSSLPRALLVTRYRIMGQS